MTQTPDNSSEVQMHNVGVVIVTATANLVSISLALGAAFWLTSTRSPAFVFMLTVVATYVGALAVKALLPTQYPRSPTLIGVAFWLCITSGVALFFGFNELFSAVDIPFRTRQEMYPFLAPLIFGGASYCNYWLCHRDFGKAGPIDWGTTWGVLLILGILLTFSSFVPENKPEPKFHDYRGGPDQVVF